jgi:hypothetical protein
MLGFDREDVVVALNDTADLSASIFNARGEPVKSEDLTEVSWEIQKPDGTRVTNLLGDIDDDGIGTLQYETDQVGWYVAVASFTMNNGTRKSRTTNFEVFDPFNPPEPTDPEIVANLVWDKVEDCFDSEEEGPWLRDMTLNVFNRTKMTEFIAEGLFDINQQNPPTGITMEGFFAGAGHPNSDMPLLVQGTFLSVVRHLMRSYVEQPQPMGSQVVYEDRREYLQRWQVIYEIEMETYSRWIALWKRKYLHLGTSKSLVSTKAGRLFPATMRTRNIGRGYY